MPSLIAGYHSFVHSFICTNSYLRRAQRSGTVLGMGKTGVNRTDGSSPRGVCSLLRWGCTIEISYVSIHSAFPTPPPNTYTIRQIAACSKRKRGNYTEWLESRLSVSAQMCSDVRVWNRCREGSKPLESKKTHTLFSGRTCFSDASLWPARIGVGSCRKQEF